MQQIEISEEALPILKSSITFQKRLLAVKIENYFQRLQNFEKKYNMKSKTFFKDFEAGELGDSPEWYDWLFVYEAYNKTIKKKQILERFSL